MSGGERTRTLGQTVRELVETLLLAAGVYLGVQFIVPPYAVDGASMNPALANGERLLVNRTAYAHVDVNALWSLIPGIEQSEPHVVYPFSRPMRGDIVVFSPPVTSDQPYIKRVIGLAGDSIRFAGGYVYVNDERLDEPYQALPETFCVDAVHCRLVVPENAVYVLGDNRTNSADSRYFGVVSFDAIVGKAWLANWPLDQFGLIPSVAYEP
ncbi:MAG: signal peptidase I [Chloroflexota bacterium]|nr:signal peptidase I [Chloroflexota bacterium]